MRTTATVVNISIALGGFLNVAEDRFRQLFVAVTYFSQPGVDDKLKALLGANEQWMLLSRLSPYDRGHHLCVWTKLRETGQRDPDLLRAALLHDVGKADENGRVLLFHRVVRVLARRFAPEMLSTFAGQTSRFYVHGLYLAEHHAVLGATLARKAGVSERCRYLIAMHERETANGDDALRALILADQRAHW